MSMEFLEVVERIDLVQLARLNQTHVQIADRGAIIRLIEQRVLTMNNGLFQRPLDHIVVQRRAGHAQEQRELRPVAPQILQRRAER
jgi:hypothetical protein